MKLLIISHTAHYETSQGTIVGWGPTIKEINYLSTMFSEIYHIAVFHSEEPPKSATPYTSTNIHFIPIKPSGGKNLFQKFSIILQAPKTISIIRKTLKKVDYFHFRAPTGIGVYIIPYLAFFSKKKGWFKYAGNWKQQEISFGYRLQRWLLKKQSKKVTVNGTWNENLPQTFAFENPCLDLQDRESGNLIVASKDYTNKYNYCFVGGLNHNKGILKILNVFKKLNHENIGSFHIVGDGELNEIVNQELSSIKNKVIFHGFLAKDNIQEVYETCHFIILPSLNEGFPKVIGEAMNYGCIPIVSEISCINQYIKNNENGFLLESINEKGILEAIKKSLELSPNEIKSYININYEKANLFTYEYYLRRIKKEIL